MDASYPETNRRLRLSIATGIVILVLLVSVPIAFQGLPGSTGVSRGTGAPAVREYPGYLPFTPFFTAPADKIREMSSQEFAQKLYREALAYEPLLGTNGTQVHMGYWSGRGNHGSLVSLLDAINDLPLSATQTPQKAVWDEGATSSNQYPLYVRMLDEHWYERAGSRNGTVFIFGVTYTDPYPVTFTQADDIWGLYSQRYTDMAGLIFQATGKPVRAWCFVEGARANRIFYKYELPELRLLEQKGAARVYFAKTRTANWTNTDDWIEGTAHAPVPVPAN